jgi:4-amino-4-deoxy-L-arabinose transferase-like glycosyltransferase
LLALALALPPMVIDLARPHVVDPREARALVVSLQTVRYHQEATPALSLQWFTPHFNGKPLLAEAPGLTWFQVAVFQLIPHHLEVDRYVLAARILSIVLGLVLIGSSYWAGLSIGGLRAALLAALTAASLPLVVVESRLAGAPIATAAFVMLAIASALWAVRPLRSNPGVVRQVIGWSTCGLSLAMAALILGPGAIPVTLLPILVILLMSPGRVGHLLGLLAAVCLAALSIVPWAAFVHDADPETWRWWGWAWINTTYWLDGEAAPLGVTLGKRLATLTVATLPWTLWLLASVMQPFSASSGGSRRRLFVGWGWWLTLTVLYLAAPAVGAAVYLLIALPAAGVMLGLVFDQFAEQCDAGRYPRIWRFVRWPQMLLLLAASLLAGVLLLGQDWLIRHRFLTEPMLADLGWPYGLGAVIVLLSLTGLSISTAIQQRPQRTHIYTALWAIALMGMMALPVTRGAMASCAKRQEGRKLQAATAQSLTYWLRPERGQVELDPVLLLYADRELLPITPSELAEALRQHASLHVLTPLGHDQPAPGAAPVMELPRAGLRLWRVMQPEPAQP